MTGTTTELGLATATDSDFVEVYGVTSLVTALNTIDALFSATTGHAHDGLHKGKPITSAGIASGVTLTSPHFTTPVVDSGGLAVTAGNLTLSGGTVSLTDGTNGLIQSAGATGDLYLRAKSGAQYVRMDTGGVIISAGAAGFQTATTTSLGFYGHALAAQAALGAAATDLASVITLANNIRSALQGNGLCG